MPEVIEMKSAAELKAQEPPPFVPSQSDAKPAPTADEEAQLRALFQQAAASGQDDLNTSVTMPAPEVQAQPAPAPVQPTAPIDVPAKFQKPDGTVDEDKLKASSKQLDEALAGKQEKQKSIDEMLTEYKDKERQFKELSRTQAETVKQMPPALPASLPVAPAPGQDMNQLHQQILQDMRNDPVGATVMLTQALLDKKLEPLMERFQQEEEVRRDGAMRENIAKLAQTDPRVLNPPLYAEMMTELNSDPGYFRLKNPHKAAWNEVKGRLRLGEATPQAQPINSSPMLGSGSPPSVSTLPGPMTPQTISNQVQTLNPYSNEGKAFEEKLREATRTLWQ
jgi:hypothetical protein